MDDAHVLDDLFLDLCRAVHREVVEEVVGDGDQRVTRPALEPIHGTPRDEPRELEGPGPELLSHLKTAGEQSQWRFYNVGSYICDACTGCLKVLLSTVQLTQHVDTVA